MAIDRDRLLVGATGTLMGRSDPEKTRMKGVLRCCSNGRPLRAIDNKPDGYRLLMPASTYRWPGCVMSRISLQEDGGEFTAAIIVNRNLCCS